MKIIKNVGLAFLSGLFFILISFSLQARLSVGIIDTGFCPSTEKSKITVAPVFDATNSVKAICPAKDRKSFRYHGQWILDELTSQVMRDLTIFPVIVFDHEGMQKNTYWEKALQYLNKKEVDVILMASSLPVEKASLNLQLPSKAMAFVASGQMGGPIREQTKLWPQSEKEKFNLIVIGGYLSEEKEKIFDPKLLNQEKIDYYFNAQRSAKKILKGSSLAVTQALIRALKICPQTLSKKCLKQKAKPIHLWPRKERFYTF